MFIDTHAHLYLPEFDEDRDLMLQRALEAGVSAFYLPNVDQRTIPSMLALESAFAGHCFAMMGLHPCSVNETYQAELAIVEEWLSKRPFSAVGEIGIDLYWDKTHFEEQVKAFRTQLRWSAELGLPVSIHSRESTSIVIDILKKEQDSRLHGIFHCFSGTLEEANAIIGLGFVLGIGGVLTFKNSGLDKIITEVPLEYLVLETDAPYLAPVPHRGKRNESAYIRLVAERLATIKNVDIQTVGLTTTNTAQKIFKKIKQAYTTLS